MANPLRIYSGPGEIGVYDATNAAKFLGYSDAIELKGEPLKIDLMDDNTLQYATLFKLSASLLQSDQNMIAALKARRSTKQEITIVGLEAAARVKNVFLALAPKRTFKAGEVHTIDLLAQTSVEADVFLMENLLGKYGNFDTDSNGDSLADGWESNVPDTRLSVVASFLSGRGNAQEVHFAVDGEYIRLKSDRLMFQTPRQVVFSVYMQTTSGGATGPVSMGVNFLRADGSSIESYYESKTLSASATRYSVSYSIDPSEAVYAIVAEVKRVPGTNADFYMDDAQLEFGSLTDYVENDL